MQCVKISIRCTVCGPTAAGMQNNGLVRIFLRIVAVEGYGDRGWLNMECQE